MIKTKVPFWNNDHNNNRNKIRNDKTCRKKYGKLYKKIMTVKLMWKHKQKSENKQKITLLWKQTKPIDKQKAICITNINYIENNDKQQHKLCHAYHQDQEQWECCCFEAHQPAASPRHLQFCFLSIMWSASASYACVQIIWEIKAIAIIKINHNLLIGKRLFAVCGIFFNNDQNT